MPAPISPTSTSVSLNNWRFRQAGKNQPWTPCKHSSPTTEIFPDLIDHCIIPDPFLDQNEKLVQWVGETDWEYSTEFDFTPGRPFNYLVFEGLDTYATVFLNGEQILYSHNMFHVHRLDVTGKLKVGTNALVIRFNSALREAKAEEAMHKPMHLWNGDSSRLYARKAQYHFGWDWGPVLLTCGPWKPVRLESFTTNIDDVYLHAKVDGDLNAQVEIQVAVTTAVDVTAEVSLISPDGRAVAKHSVDILASNNSSSRSIQLFVESPALWYPMRYGPQNFYEAKVKIMGANNDTVCFTRRSGFRRVELVEGNLVDQEGSSFFFKVNNIPIYMAGSNWIPAHNFLTRLSAKDYQDWVNLAIEGNQNMLRVWAGGVFEDDCFYEACDNAGVLVWQDFLFGCGVYPYYQKMADSVAKECEDQLKRLRNHASIIVYAGNNEDYQIAEEAKLQWDPQDKDYVNSGYPARAYYEKILPEILEKTAPGAVYRFGCPYGGPTSGDLKIGDVHQWNVWHGTQEKYQDWAKLAGRFVSEFGMLALPNIKTLRKAITDESELYPQSATMDLHNKADGYERRLALYVMENLRVNSMDIDSWIYATQLMQAECLAYAYRCWRRNWKGPGKEYTAGALVWQINDCWPVTSWGICDFYKTPKLAYYAIKREAGPLGLGIYRNTVAVENPSGQKVAWLQKNNFFFDVWGVNMSVEEKEYELEIRTYHIESGNLVSQSERQHVVLAPNRSTELSTGVFVSNDTAVEARLFEGSSVVARAYDWPQPLKYLKFPTRGVSLKVESGLIRISVEKPVKGLELICESKKCVKLEDNGFDIFPDEEITILADGLEESDRVSHRYYQ